MDLKEAINFFLTKRQGIPQAVPAGISGFLTSFEKGPSKIRKILCKKQLESLKIMSKSSVNTLINLI
jgi:hypothetical protein